MSILASGSLATVHVWWIFDQVHWLELFQQTALLDHAEVATATSTIWLAVQMLSLHCFACLFARVLSYFSLGGRRAGHCSWAVEAAVRVLAVHVRVWRVRIRQRIGSCLLLMTNVWRWVWLLIGQCRLNHIIRIRTNSSCLSLLNLQRLNILLRGHCLFISGASEASWQWSASSRVRDS